MTPVVSGSKQRTAVETGWQLTNASGLSFLGGWPLAAKSAFEGRSPMCPFLEVLQDAKREAVAETKKCTRLTGCIFCR
jgi:hypothetical protein